MQRILLLSLILFVGCATVPQTEQAVVAPELISLAPLPPYRGTTFRQNLRLEILMYVTKTGTVEDAQLQGTSGDPQWDSLALKAVRDWRFTAPKRNGIPTDLWIHQVVTVQFQEPVLMVLAEIVCGSQHQGDSLYAMLEQGADFATLARQAGGSLSSANGGSLGTVDISLYPPQVREALRKLSVGDLTHPIRIGDKFTIFKRLPKQVSQTDTQGSVGSLRVVPLDWIGTKP